MKKYQNLAIDVSIIIVLLAVVFTFIYIFSFRDDPKLSVNTTYLDYEVVDIDSKMVGKMKYYYGVFKKGDQEIKVEIDQYVYETIKNFDEFSDASNDRNTIKFDLIVNESNKALGVSYSKNREETK